MSQVSDCYVFNDKYSSWIANGIFQEIDEADIIKLIELNHPTKKYELDGLLIIACWKGTEKVVMKLLELGANKDARSKTGTTPIMFLAERDWLEMVEYFIKLGADLLIRAKNGDDVLLYSKNKQKTRDYFLRKLYNDAQEQNELTKKNKELSEKVTTLTASNKELESKLKETKDSSIDDEKKALFNENVTLKSKLQKIESMCISEMRRNQES